MRVRRNRNTPEGIVARHMQEGDGCWLWSGTKTPAGYGHVSIDRKTRYIHRVFYEQLVGPIPEGLEIDHVCRQRHCYNPAHLRAVTIQENRQTRVYSKSALRSQCKRGHPLVEGNLYYQKRGRACRLCSIYRAQRSRLSRRNGRGQADRRQAGAVSP